MSRYTTIIVLATLWVCIATTTNAQSPIELKGVVMRPDDRPAAGAVVTVRGTTYRATTNDEGRFTIVGLVAGTYEIEATLQGYVAASAAMTVAPDRPIDITLRLRAVAGVNEQVDVFGAIPTSSTILKDATPLVETPLSVQVIPSQRIELQRAQSLNEALRYSAGVQSEWYGGLDQAFDFFTIRGFGSFIGGTFRDGLQLYTFGFNGFRVEPYGAESMTVLRGAASVLYGQTGPGGIVNVVSKTPPTQALHEASLELGNYNHVQAKIDLGGPIRDGSAVRYRVTGLFRDAGTQVDFQPNDRVFVAPAVSWEGQRSKFTALGHYQRDLTQHFQFLPIVGTAAPSPNGRIPATRADGEPGFDHFERHQYGAGYQFQQRFGRAWQFVQNTRFDHVGVDYADVFGGTLLESDPTQRLLARNTFTILGASDVFAVDSQAHHVLDRGALRNTLMVGAEYQRSTFESVDGFGDAPPLDAFTPHYGAAVVRPEPYADAVTTRNQTGFYLHDRVNLRGGVVAMFSGRQNVVNDDIDDRLAGTKTEGDSHKFVWQSGVAYVSPSGLVPHVSYSESFSPLNGTDVNGIRYVPETGQQYEAGVRYQAKGGRAMASAALFDLRRQNVLTPDAGNPNNQIQTGEVRSRGVELEFEAGIAPGSSLIASYTYQDVEITKSNAGDQGLRPAVIPKNMASLWFNHTVRQGVARGVGGGLGVRYQGATLDSANTLEVDGFTVVDALASYTFRSLRFAVNAQNLFDKEYLAGCSGNCYFGRSRTVVGSTTYRW